MAFLYLRGERGQTVEGLLKPAETDPEYGLHEQARFGNVGVRVDAVIADPRKDFLAIRLKVRNHNSARYATVAGQPDRAVLTDVHGNAYPTRPSPGGKPLETDPVQLRSDHPVTDDLGFGYPLPGATKVMLTLDATRYGGTGRFRFAIPRSAWERPFRASNSEESVPVNDAAALTPPPVPAAPPRPADPPVAPEPEPARSPVVIRPPVGRGEFLEPEDQETELLVGNIAEGFGKPFAFTDGQDKWIARKPLAPTIGFRPKVKTPPPHTVLLKPSPSRPVALARTYHAYDFWQSAQAKRDQGAMDRLVETGEVVLAEEPYPVAVLHRLKGSVIVRVEDGPFVGKTCTVSPFDVGE